MTLSVISNELAYLVHTNGHSELICDFRRPMLFGNNINGWMNEVVKRYRNKNININNRR